MKLFDDNDDVSNDISHIEIDQDYARRFEHNKKREDLHRYEELKKKGHIDESDESDESESEEEDDDLDLKKKDLEFFDALIKVRNRDPILKEKEVKLFDSDESDGENTKEKVDKAERKNPMYLKDVMAKHLMEDGPELQDEEEGYDAMEHKNNKKKLKSYNEEQEDLIKSVLDAVEGVEGPEDDDQEDFMKVKETSEDELDGNNHEVVEKLDEYFGGDEELDEKDLFLKEFFKNKMWMDKENKGKKVVLPKDELDELENDEEEIERQEDYETNFRYEENVGDRVLGHARKVDGSVRKKETARKEQRKNKEDRMKIAELERQEELKHMKNLKKKEIKEKMKKVFSIAGFSEDHECPFTAKALEAEFDPDEYDKMMKAAFDDNYYDAEDDDAEFGSDMDDEKPDFSKEDELLGLPKDWDVLESGDGFLAARERSLKQKLANGDDHEIVEDEEEEEDDDDEDEDDDNDEEQVEEENKDTEESKRKRKRKISLVKRAKEEMMEEYYKLDYEDTIGDLKTRFKYAKIPANRYGLTTPEILVMDDNELNQYVSLKKIAPYRPEEWKVPDAKRYQQKMKNKELLRGGKVDDHKKSKKKSKHHDGKMVINDQKTENESSSYVVTTDEGDEKTNVDKSDVDMNTLSRRAKRRRRQAELKLSQSRLVAYGKIPPPQSKK